MWIRRKINFCSRVLRLSVLPWLGKAAEWHMLLRIIGEKSVSWSVQMRLCRLKYLYVAKVFSESVALSSPCFADLKRFAKSASYAVDDFCWETGEMISDLGGSLESRNFLNATNKMTCFVLCAHAFSLKFRVDYLFGIHFWLKRYLCFCLVGKVGYKAKLLLSFIRSYSQNS